MITIDNFYDIHGRVRSLTLEAKNELYIDGTGLVALPALIDPHVHFRTPGFEYKEDWKTGARAALAGGVTTVFDMPNHSPPCTTYEKMKEKKDLIDQQLDSVGIPLRYYLYLGADKKHLSEIGRVHSEAVAIKVFMGSSTGDLLVDDDQTLEQVFIQASRAGSVVAVHAECECTLRMMQEKYKGETDPATHSKVRSKKAAFQAVQKVLTFAEKYSVSLYILHVSTKEEVELIRKAKAQGLSLFAETTPHYLFYTQEAYQAWGTKVQMNPPLREKVDQDALWEALDEGAIDAIGTDHAPHTVEEKTLPFGQAPSGVPGVETMLPLLLDAHSKGKISLEKIVEITRTNVEKFFSLPSHEDWVFVRLDKVRVVDESHLKTKCSWSPFSGMELKGWPVYTTCRGRVYRVDTPGREIKNLSQPQMKSSVSHVV